MKVKKMYLIQGQKHSVLFFILVAPSYFKIKYRDTSLTLARTSHCLNLHFCRILFGPPNFFMSLQKSHWAQSSVLLQGSHSPHILTERFTWGQSHNRQWEPLHPKRWLYLFSPWKWMGVDVTQRIIFILKQSAMQPVTFIWLSESSFCNHVPYNTLLTCSNYCKSVRILNLLEVLFKYPWDVAVNPNELVHKCDLLWIHAAFRSYSLEYLGCCTVFQLCQTLILWFLCFSLICTLFPVRGFCLVTRGIMQQCLICFNDL